MTFEERLEAFNRKVAQLEELTFLKVPNTAATVAFDHETGWDESFEGPTREQNAALILSLRQFSQNNDPLSLNNMRQAYDASLSVPALARERFFKQCEVLNKFLDSNSMLAIEEGRSLTHRDLLDLFVYGDYAHTEETKHKLYRTLEGGPFFSIFQAEFAHVLFTFVACVRRLRDFNAQALTGNV